MTGIIPVALRLGHNLPIELFEPDFLASRVRIAQRAVDSFFWVPYAACSASSLRLRQTRRIHCITL